MNAQNQLDEWDFQLILTFKRLNGTDIFNKLRTLWAERDGVSPSEIRLPYIVSELENIREFIYSQNPASVNSTWALLILCSPYEFNMHYSDSLEEIAAMPADEIYWAKFILAYGSIIRFVGIKNLPGLSEYFENVWKKAGKP